MNSWQWAVLLKPIGALVVFLAIVYPVAAVLRRSIPDGPVKRFLFRERTRPEASRRDKVVMTLGVVLAYAGIFWLVSLYS